MDLREKIVRATDEVLAAQTKMALAERQAHTDVEARDDASEGLDAAWDELANAITRKVDQILEQNHG